MVLLVNRILLSLTVACCAAASAYAAQLGAGPDAFRTNAQFSVDKDVLRFSSVVAVVESRPSPPGHSVLRVYFYSFPFSADDIAGLANGSVEPLERKRMQTASAQERNRSRAVLHLLLNEGSNLWNASLEVPGTTCTIVVAPENVKAAFQEYAFNGKQLRLKGKGASTCDLTSVGAGKRELSWDVDVRILVFTKY